MFDSVLNKGLKPKSRFGAGTTIAILFHAGVIGAVAWITTAPVDLDLPDTAVTFYAAPPPPPPPPPPAKKHHVEQQKKIKPKPDVIVQPTMIPTEKPPEVEQPPDEPESDNDEGVEGGVEGGVVGGVVGGVLGGTVGGTGQDVLAFGEGMTRPERVSGADPVYTREALEAHVQGLMIVKCVISTDGSIHNCRIIKPLPFMEKAVLDALATRRYKPVTFQGRPITCDYVFNIKLVMPSR
ncbi:MAG TPA: energy transducer TonB [Myxococcaceae bacterium]|nr:energy transducer TonB [Myxococcaceae bacterium]